MIDKGVEALCCIFGPMRDEVDNSSWETSFLEQLRDEVVRSWTEFRTLNEHLDKQAANRFHRIEIRTLSIAVLPAATAAATERSPKIRGAFQGAIPRTTPRGSIKTNACV